MKKNLFILVILAIVAGLTSCDINDEPTQLANGKVEFGFSLPELKTTLSTTATDSSSIVAVVVDIEDLDGLAIYTSEEIKLYNMNGVFISAPLSLEVGDYNVTKFLVVNSANDVLYATPTLGSEAAYLVNQPAPIAISISKDLTLKVIPEVISTNAFTPADFGYATFGIDFIETFSFFIGAFVYDTSDENFRLTEADITVSANGEDIYNNSFGAITKLVTLVDEFENYTITVSKEGYSNYEATYSNAELKQYGEKPIEVILEKSDLIYEIESKVEDFMIYRSYYEISGNIRTFIDYSDFDELRNSAWTASGQPKYYRNYIQWNGLSMVPNHALIDSAFLDITYTDNSRQRIHCDAYGKENLTALLQRIIEPWDENTTYDSRPATTSENEATLPDVTNRQPTIGRSPENFSDENYKINITQLIQDMVNNGNYGMMIRMEEEVAYSSWNCYSFTNTDESKRAKIKVYWH